MLHLLPKEYMRRLRQEYLLRFGNVLAHLLAVVGIVGAGLLLPTYLELSESNYDTKSVDKSKPEENALSIEELQKFKNNFEEKTEHVYAMDDLANLQELEVITRAIGVGVRLTSLTVEKQVGTNVVIQVSGSADTRQALSDFVDTLRASSEFSTVDAPLSLFTKDRDIVFNISVVGNTATSTTP